jgi:hypothetical protein
MPRQGRVWRWSDGELDRAAILLARWATNGTFRMPDIYRASHAITALTVHGIALRAALLLKGRIEVVDRSNERRYVYRVKGSDGEQAQRPASATD